MKYKILLLFLVLFISVSTSFAMMESDFNISQTDIGGINEMGVSSDDLTNSVDGEKGNYSESDMLKINEQQRQWYSRNYKNLESYIESYLKDHDYFDGASIDLPNDPFPYNDMDFRYIAYNKNSDSIRAIGVNLERLSRYLEPDFQKALANNGFFGYNPDGSVKVIINSGLGGNIVGNSNSNVSSQSFNEIKPNVTSLNHIDEGNSSFDINHTISDKQNTSNSNIVRAQTLEKTCIPIAMLVLVILSVFGLRRKD